MANQHIVERAGGWAVLKEKAERDTAHMKTQSEAISKAREIAEHQGGDVIIHGKDGKIRERNTYGKEDLFPPKG